MRTLQGTLIIRRWWLDSLSRGESVSLELITEKYFSVSIISDEFERLQLSLRESRFQDDRLEVKMSKISREVVVKFNIDDQIMEIVVRLPTCYPLRQAEVEGTKRVGVKEAQYRAWLLASQSTIAYHNGSIIDAIYVFFKNVSLHFEGVAECAICYSVLAAQDKSLPSKRCGTCKNKFHGVCLYKVKFFHGGCSFNSGLRRVWPATVRCVGSFCDYF